MTDLFPNASRKPPVSGLDLASGPDISVESEWDLTGEKPVMVSCRIVQPCQAVNAGRGEHD
jgi:hypothetical protein